MRAAMKQASAITWALRIVTTIALGASAYAWGEMSFKVKDLEAQQHTSISTEAATAAALQQICTAVQSIDQRLGRIEGALFTK